MKFIVPDYVLLIFYRPTCFKNKTTISDAHNDFRKLVFLIF